LFAEKLQDIAFSGRWQRLQSIKFHDWTSDLEMLGYSPSMGSMRTLSSWIFIDNYHLKQKTVSNAAKRMEEF
jgi:hypothetical protein